MSTDLPYTQHWSISPSDGVVTDIDDINQAIHNIFITEIGSDVLRPDFGGNWQQYIDYPTDELMVYLVRELTLSIKKWEPRVIVDLISPIAEAEHLRCTVRYFIRPEIAGQFKNRRLSTELVYAY